MELSADVIGLIKSGGTPALLICVIFIYRVERRLARIEKAFDMLIQRFLPKAEAEILKESA